MNPSPRTADILHAISDLSPAQAAAYLREVVSVLDAAERSVLRRMLPAAVMPLAVAPAAPQAAPTEMLDPQALPTIQSTFPKPWEYAEAAEREAAAEAAAPVSSGKPSVSTGQLVQEALRPSRGRVWALAGAGLLAGVALGLVAWTTHRPAAAPSVPAPAVAAASPAPSAVAAVELSPLAARAKPSLARSSAKRAAPAHHAAKPLGFLQAPLHRTSVALVSAQPVPGVPSDDAFGERL